MDGQGHIGERERRSGCFAYLTGLDALHQGIEVDFVLHPIEDLEITGSVFRLVTGIGMVMVKDMLIIRQADLWVRMVNR